MWSVNDLLGTGQHHTHGPALQGLCSAYDAQGYDDPQAKGVSLHHTPPRRRSRSAHAGNLFQLGGAGVLLSLARTRLLCGYEDTLLAPESACVLHSTRARCSNSRGLTPSSKNTQTRAHTGAYPTQTHTRTLNAPMHAQTRTSTRATRTRHTPRSTHATHFGLAIPMTWCS